MAVKSKRRFLGFAPCPPSLDPRYNEPVIALNTEITAGTTLGTKATATSGNAQNYDCSTNNSLTVYISKGGDTTYIKCGPITINGANNAAVTAAEAVADLNANVMFTKYAVADVDTTSVRITLRDIGDHGAFYVTGTANTPLGFTAVAHASRAVGTGDQAVVPVKITDSKGMSLPFAHVTATLYAGSTGDTKDATAIINRATVGEIVSGMNTNTVALEANAAGLLTIEIGDTAAAAADSYIEFTVTGTDLILPIAGAARTKVITDPS